MFLKTILFFTLSLMLMAESTLKDNYYITTDDINLSTLIPTVKNDTKLFAMQKGKQTKRVKSQALIKLLEKFGYKDFSSKHRYVKFTKKSPIDTSRIERILGELYKNRYKNISIKSVEVRPRSYLSTLPEKYQVSIQAKNYLKSRGILSIKDEKKRQLFFDYTIDARLDVYQAKENIKRNSELSHVNCVKNSIILDKFRAMPLQELIQGRLQSKNHVKMGKVLTLRDTQGLKLVRRGSTVQITLKNENIAISFSGEALENGVYGDIIRVRQNKSKIHNVRITGKGKGEII